MIVAGVGYPDSAERIRNHARAVSQEIGRNSDSEFPYDCIFVLLCQYGLAAYLLFLSACIDVCWPVHHNEPPGTDMTNDYVGKALA